MRALKSVQASAYSGSPGSWTRPRSRWRSSWRPGSWTSDISITDGRAPRAIPTGGSGGGLDLGLEGRAAAREHAAVDREGRAGDPGRLAAGEEEDRLDDIAGLAAAAERVEAVDRVEHLLRLVGREEALVGGRLHEREGDRVHADVLARQLECEVLGQRVATGLGGRVRAGRGGGDRVDRPHRADVDDRAAAALAHREDGRLRH